MDKKNYFKKIRKNLPIHVERRISIKYNVKSNQVLSGLKNAMRVKSYEDLEIGKGYSMMGQINIELSEMGMIEDYNEFKEYEDRLTGSDK